jgi:hypothetical protein
MLLRGLFLVAVVEATMASQGPALFFYNASLLAHTRSLIAAGDPSVMPAAEALSLWADKALGWGPWSVLNRTSDNVPPHATANDYVSIGTYFWPCTCTDPPSGPNCVTASPSSSSSSSPTLTLSPPACNATTGLPWVDHDGVTNTRSMAEYNQPDVQQYTSALTQMALAYYFTGNETYATRAVEWMRVWHLDPVTGMRPNFNFGQYVPGVCDGRGTGLIDITQYMGTGLLDSFVLLSASPSWAQSDTEGLQAWFTAFLEWLVTSPIAAQEAASLNNHLTWFRSAVQCTALFVNNASVAAAFAAEDGARVVDVQIERDGELPLEEARTRSFFYVSYDTHALIALGRMSALSGTDLFRFVNANGSSISTALDHLIPYVTGARVWPFEQLGGDLDTSTFFDIYRIAAYAYPENASVYAAVAENTTNATAPSDLRRLVWPWPPAPPAQGA